MLGIDYASSDEEDVAPVEVLKSTNILIANAKAPATTPLSKFDPGEPEIAASASISRPAQGPAVPAPEEEDGPDNTTRSEISTRAMIQSLTLPTVPNFDIPASPPGSPPLKATKKFAQFLDLKKKGQHFNQRLEGSSVLRDPGHLQRLMDFAGIVAEDSYATTLSNDIAIPTVFPEWAYVEALRTSQKNIFSAREQGRSKVRRENVEFVAATKSGTSSGTGTPAVNGLKRQSAAERAMEDVDIEQPNLQGTSKRKQLEHRGRDHSSSRASLTRQSRSPKRRRSGSRDE